MARRRGWGGRPPADDTEATARIVAAAVDLLDSTGSAISIADVAASLGVIRQTVYRYFRTADDLMRAAGIASTAGFLDRLAEHLHGLDEPAEAMTEGVLFTLEEASRTPRLGVLLAGTHPGGIASPEARELGLQMVTRFDVDWAAHGYDDAALTELVEFTLRVMLSFFAAPNDPERDRAGLRAFVRRWLGGAILAQTGGPDAAQAN